MLGQSLKTTARLHHQSARAFHKSAPTSGALLGKIYNFTARPWELRHVDAIDPFDAMGTNMEVHVRGTDIMRLIPRDNDEINEFLCTGKHNREIRSSERRGLRGWLAIAHFRPIAHIYYC